MSKCLTQLKLPPETKYQTVKFFSFEKITLEDERVCVIFTQTYEDLSGNTKTQSRTVCSYKHTAEQLQEILCELYSDKLMP